MNGHNNRIVVQCIMERDMLKQRNIYREVYADKFEVRQVVHSILLGLQGLRLFALDFSTDQIESSRTLYTADQASSTSGNNLKITTTLTTKALDRLCY